MIIKKYPAPPIEDAASRYDRDWLNIPDLDTAGEEDYRHDRTLLRQPVERKSRRYVDDGVSAVTGGPYMYDDGVVITPVDPEEPSEWNWVDDFTSSELNSRWTVGPNDTGGGFNINTAGSITEINFTPGVDDFEVRIITTINGQAVLQAGLPMAKVFASAGDLSLASLYDLDYVPGENLDIVYRVIDKKLSLIVNGEAVAENWPPSREDVDYTTFDLVFGLMEGVGSVIINSVSFKDLTESSENHEPTNPGDSAPVDPGDNGGGTPEPEPETPEEPSEPEVPAGTYQDEYKEIY